MSKVLPIFKSHYSLGRSILTLEKPSEDSYPTSIISLLKANGMDTLVLVDDNVTGLLQANKQCQDNKIKLIFGVRITVTNDMAKKDEASLSEEAKYIVFVKSTEGYKLLIRLWSLAAKDGFYYIPRIDFKALKSLWDDKHLLLAVPFYDSFLFCNSLEGHKHVPQFNFTKPVFLLEEHGLPFDELIAPRVQTYAQENGYDTMRAHSIYYKSPEDFLAYMAFRCIHNRTTIEKPELNHMSSDSFSFDTWKQLNEKA